MTTKFYGLTGGIGCGKSTVAKIFSNYGVPVLDLDVIGHDILKNNAQIKQQLIKTFGSYILNDQGIDRKKLSQLVFQSKANTEKLNQIMHPAIAFAEQKWRAKQNATFAIIEASVLIESGGVSRMFALIVVLADLEIRKQRVLQRGQQDSATFQTIVAQQCSDQQRTAQADIIINNNGDIKHLEQKVATLYEQMMMAKQR